MFSSIFGKNKSYYATKTFTYYIPAPPVRKNGYQEKEFDHVIDYLNTRGFDLIDFKLASHASEDKSGMWVVCHIGAATKTIFNQELDFNSIQDHDQYTSNISIDPDIVHD